jgi:precorrin-8X/cobalt-precorrin-8 methylmutase
MGELDRLEFVRPADIERRSFEIIARELDGKALDPRNAPVIKRVIHTSADFDYADSLVFSDGATRIGVEALRNGCSIVTDTNMAAAGINKRVLARFGGQVHTYISDADVAAEAKERGLTRSAVCMERAAALGEPLIFAIGNAPTALVRLYEMLQAGLMPCEPVLIIGVPVGFVNVVESKELICTLDVPHIVARGRKGGSNVAAAICNALLYLASNDVRE